MKVQVNLQVLVSTTFLGAELDIPESVVNAGKDAILTWAKQNVRLVNGAEVSSTETYDVREVTDVLGIWE